MKMFFSNQWHDKDDRIDVRNPYDGSVIDTVPRGDAADIDQAIATLVEGAKQMRKLSAWDRCQILRKVSAIMSQRQEELGTIISREEGKILKEGLIEADRAREIIDLSAEEARRITGEMVPLDAAPGAAGKIGFTLRVPCGVVAAITPFNFPLHLVCHKVGPAIAAGNAILIKPASDTPLSALKLVEILLEAGLPSEAVACITGPGGEIGQAICEDSRVRKISFTGSYDTGEVICRMAGVKRITMELGSNSPVIIMDDANLDRAVEILVTAGYANAGQTCISTQRILTAESIRGDLIDALKPRVESLTTGDQLAEGVHVGPLVREADAVRVESCIREAVQQGATLVTGGERQGAICQPAILDNVSPEMSISRDELFGPAMAITTFSDLDEAIRLANDTRYGLSAGIFTQDIDRAMRFVQEVDSGNLQVNWASQWRADLMPYGGLKQSGTGKEGPRYAVREMTEEKMVILHVGG